jgi:NADH-quinone oxidoreductase subunit C
MPQTLASLSSCLENALGDARVDTVERLGELTVVVHAAQLMQAMLALRDHAQCRFEQLLDLCGLDYSDYGDGAWIGKRFAVVYHLLSVSLNQRVRVRVFCADDDLPLVASMVDIWPITVSSAIRSAKISRSRATSKCVMTQRSSA